MFKVNLDNTLKNLMHYFNNGIFQNKIFEIKEKICVRNHY